jgi:hypothetical protein
MSLTDILNKLTTEQLTFYAYIGASTYVGAFVLYILNRLQKRLPFSLFSALNIDTTSDNARPLVIFVDMLLSSLIGTIVVIPLTSPGTVPQAIVAGLGMTGVLSVYAKEKGETR